MKSRQLEINLHRSVADFLSWVVLPPAVWTTFPAGWTQMRRGASGRLKACGLQAGMPDILIFNRGRTIGIELKVPGGKPTPAQLDMFNRMQAAGIPVAIARSLDDVFAILVGYDVPIRKIANAKSFKASEGRRPQEPAQSESRAP